jgi:hypothetical protein
MSLVGKIRGWFGAEREKEREHELEQAEEELRDPSLRHEEEKLYPPGAQSGYTPGGAERIFEE